MGEIGRKELRRKWSVEKNTTVWRTYFEGPGRRKEQYGSLPTEIEKKKKINVTE